GALSHAQGIAEFSAPAGTAHFHREPHRLRPPALQRTGPAIQHSAGRVSPQPGGRNVRVFGVTDVRGGSRGEGECAGECMTEPFLNHRNQPAGSNNFEHLVRGSLLLILASWMGVGNIAALYRLRIGTFVLWHVADEVLRLTAAVFFAWF